MKRPMGMTLMMLLALGCGGADDTRIKTLDDDLREGDRVVVNGVEFVALKPVIDSYSPEMDAWFDQELADVPIEKATEQLTVAAPFAITYTLPNGYGIAGDGGRCNNTSFPGGTCDVPKRRSGCIRHLAEQESPSNVMRGAASSANPAWETIMETLGWDVLVDDLACPFVTEGQISIRWGSLPPGRAGKMTPLISSGDLVGTTAGQLRPWRIAQITLDPSGIESMPGYSSRTQTQKNRFARNIAMHELFHAGGLGHNGILDTLMEAQPVQPPPISSLFLSDMAAIAAEQTLIQNYDVDG